MVQGGEELPLQLEALQDVVGVQTPLEHLDRHPPLEPIALADGQVDDPHPAAAQLADDPVRADSSGIPVALLRSQHGLVGLDDRAAQRLVVVGEKLLHLGPQVAVVAALLVEKGRPPLRLQIAGRQEELLGSLVLFTHESDAPESALSSRFSAFSFQPSLDISRRSQACPIRQSRSIVRGDTSSIRAVSSLLRPPKSRSSTTLHCRSSISRIFSSAS